MEFTILSRFKENMFWAKNDGICYFGADHVEGKFIEYHESRGDDYAVDITADFNIFLDEISANSPDYAIFETYGNKAWILGNRNLDEDYLLQISALISLVDVYREISSYICPLPSGAYSESRAKVQRFLRPFEISSNWDILDGLVDFKHKAIIARAGTPPPLIHNDQVSWAPNLTRMLASKCAVDPTILDFDHPRYPKRSKQVRGMAAGYLKQTFFKD